MKHKLILLVLLGIGLFSCKEKESPLIVLANIEGLSWRAETAKGNTPYRIKIEARSTTAAISHITMSAYDIIYGNSIVTDTLLADPVKDVVLYVNYCTPVFEAQTTVNFDIQVYATDGEHVATKMFLDVQASDYKLPSLDGLTLYSDLSGKPSCFSLLTKSTFLKKDSASIVGSYFQDVAPADSSDVLSCIWQSKDISFAKAESFNFADATANMVINAYSACQPVHTIQNLKYDDVLLFGAGLNALGVLKIMNIQDESGTDNDRYNFSIKFIYNNK